MLDNLPPELISLISNYLELKDLYYLRYTSRGLYDSLADDRLWQRAIYRGLPRSAFPYHVILHDSTGVRYKWLDHNMISCKPYGSFLELYLRLLHKYGWKIGTWVGNAPWFGSIYEVEYDPSLGDLRCSILEPWTIWTPGRSHSMHRYIFLRDFESFLEIEHTNSLPVQHECPPD